MDYTKFITIESDKRRGQPCIRRRPRTTPLGVSSRMKLLFDQNLSHRLVAKLAAEFPGSVHVRELRLAEASDPDIWDLAANRGLSSSQKTLTSAAGFAVRSPTESNLDATWQLFNIRCRSDSTSTSVGY